MLSARRWTAPKLACTKHITTCMLHAIGFGNFPLIRRFPSWPVDGVGEDPE